MVFLVGPVCNPGGLVLLLVQDLFPGFLEFRHDSDGFVKGTDVLFQVSFSQPSFEIGIYGIKVCGYLPALFKVEAALKQVDQIQCLG